MVVEVEPLGMQAAHLQGLLGPGNHAQVRVDAQAGHFTFMDEPPPGVADTHPDRAAFLAALRRDVCDFVRR